MSNFGIEIVANLLRCFDGCASGNSTVHLLDPSIDSLHLLFEAASLGINLLACLALLGLSIGVHGKFHPAGLARSVFLGAMLFEVAPLVIAAVHHVLVVEAHIDGF